MAVARAMATVACLIDNTARQTRSRLQIHKCSHHRLRKRNRVVTVRRLMALLVMQLRASGEAREAEAEVVAAVKIEEREEVEVDDEDKNEVLCELQLVAGCLRGG